MKKILPIILCFTLIFSMTACDKGGKDKKSGSGGGGGTRTTNSDFIMPEASGATVYTSDDGAISLDASNVAEGYVMVKYTGTADKIQVQITNPAGGEPYAYPLPIGDYSALPLTGGDGNYQVDVLEHVTDDLYSNGLSQPLDVTLNDEFRPYLYPNQYVNYTADSDAVSIGKDLSGKSSDDLDYVTNVYNYVTENITYDDVKAADVSLNYIPDIDETLSSGKGICFDYASVMSAMLRSQSVPTRLVVGYSGTAYHAWISVYIAEKGWVENIIEFDGTSWSIMDPTLAANNENDAVADYIGNGSNYTELYSY